MNDVMDVFNYAFHMLILLGLGFTILIVVSIVGSFRSRRRTDLVMVTKRDFTVQNADTGGEAMIFAGTHAVERIPNPRSTNGISWIVMKGTRIGMPEDYWRRWKGEHWAHFQVEILEPS